MVVNNSLIKNILSYLSPVARSNPLIDRLAREFRFRWWLLLIRLKSRTFLRVNKIIWINPNKIDYISLELTPKLYMGKVISGNWDKSLKRFEDLDVYQAFRKRFIYNKDWNTTGFYKRVLDEIKNGKIKWKCGNKKDFDKRLKKIDDLYHIIKTNGYKLGKEVRDGYHPSHDPLLREDEVTVNIGRNGTLFFNDGRHRLSIAKILNLYKIPAKVVVRHSEWMKFRKELYELTRTRNGKLYQPLTHPDLQDIPSQYGSFRFDLIRKNLSIKKGNVLDIGAHLGYFCHRFEEEGFECYAVENDPNNLYFMKKLKEAENRKFKIISQSIFNYNRKGKLSFDIVLALNVFHHFLKTKRSYEELILLLNRITAKELFFQSHKYYEPQMKGAYKNFHPEEFAQFISKHTKLKHELIGETEDNRKIYKFFK